MMSLTNRIHATADALVIQFVELETRDADIHAWALLGASLTDALMHGHREQLMMQRAVLCMPSSQQAEDEFANCVEHRCVLHQLGLMHEAVFDRTRALTPRRRRPIVMRDWHWP